MNLRQRLDELRTLAEKATPEQINAMRVYEIVTDRGTTLLDRDEAQDIYRAMLAAAPAAPQSPGRQG